MKTVYNSEIFHKLEQWAPRKLAYDWDNVGLQIGSHTDKVNKVLVTLDVLESVVDEAIMEDVDLIISHHPLLFEPVKKINLSTPKGRTIQKLLKHDISVYTAHTNLDIADGGVNDLLAKKLGITATESLINLHEDQLFKVVVYVPETHVEQVREAFHVGGAGHIGNYSHCTFQTQGQGTFKPLEGSDPFSGTKHELSRVDEVKLESIVPEQHLSSVIAEIKQAHPYDEVAYDVFLLQNESVTYGLGRVGEFNNKMSLKSLCEHIKNVFQLPNLKVTGLLNNEVKKVAILGGSGERFIFDAIKKGVDVYITGDITFHMAQEAMEMGLAIIDAGHYIEEVMKEAVKIFLEDHFANKLQIICSQRNTNPFQYI